MGFGFFMKIVKTILKKLKGNTYKKSMLLYLKANLEYKERQSCNLIVFGLIHSAFEKPLLINDESKHFIVLNPGF